LTGGKNFEFASIAQVVEPAKDVLRQAGAPEPSAAPEECKPENPAVYELRASTRDLKSWSYSTRVLRLEHNLQSTQNTSLCNFLQGEDKNITQSLNSTLASSEQASDEHSTPKIIPSFFVSSFKSKCEAANAAYKNAKTETQNAFATLSLCVTNNQPLCSEYFKSVKTAYSEYSSCLQTTSTVKECYQTLEASLSAAGKDCPCANIVESAVQVEASKGIECDSTHGKYVDVPGILPLRVSRASCFAYSNSCVAYCEPQPGFVQIVPNPFTNQLYCIIHFGLTETCTVKPPSGKEALQAAFCIAPSILQKLSSEKARLLSYWIQLIAIYQTLKKPLGEALETVEVAKRPLSKAETLSKKAKQEEQELEKIARETSQDGLVAWGDETFSLGTFSNTQCPPQTTCLP